MALLTTGVGVLVGCLFALSIPKGSEDRGLQLARSTALVVCFVLVASGIRAGLDLQEAQQLSTDILIDRPEYGPGAATLRANLSNALVIAPDRPHNPQDIAGGDRLERTTRTRAFTVSTNPQGYRTPPFISPAPGFRIAFVGDSFVFGWGVKASQAVPQQLQQVSGLEVLNLGIPAASIPMLTKIVESQAAYWDADIILFCEWPEVDTPSKQAQFASTIKRMKAAAGSARLGFILPPVSTFDPLRTFAGPDAITRIKHLAEGVPVLSLSDAIQTHGGRGVVLQSKGATQSLVSVPDGQVLAQGQGNSETIAAEIIAEFEENKELSEPLFFDGGHTNIEGNQVAARAVHQWLKSLRWIP